MRAITITLLFSFISFLNFAWNAHGHMLVASIAWDGLADESKDSVTNLLQQHPAYEVDWKKGFKKHGKDVPLGKYLMMRAARWPDDIKGKDHPNHDLRHNMWHFINYEIHFDGEDNTNPEESPKGNILMAIKESKKIFLDGTQTMENRAIHLSWLIHLLGDIHQPLHCGSLVNTDFPQGDRGGNLAYVKPKIFGIKLHALWDDGLGGNTKMRPTSNEGSEIINAYPKDSLVNMNFDNPKAWSMMSFNLAKKVGHLNGSLEYGIEKSKSVRLPKDYTAVMKKTCLEQAAYAGYRLENYINGFVD